MWMGSNVSSNGITRDLQALHDAGFGGATLFSLADLLTGFMVNRHFCEMPSMTCTETTRLRDRALAEQAVFRGQKV
jgi:hypothetical protein